MSRSSGSLLRFEGDRKKDSDEFASAQNTPGFIAEFEHAAEHTRNGAGIKGNADDRRDSNPDLPGGNSAN